MGWRYLFHGLVVIAMMVVADYLLGDVIDRHWIDVHVHGRGVWGELLFLLVGSPVVALGFSRQVVAFLAGYGFGFGQGLLLSMLAVMLGCFMAFYLARLLLRGYLSRRLGRQIRMIDDFIHENTFAMTLLLRLLPAGSNLMVNLAAGVSSVKSPPFFLGSALGYIPQMVIFTLVGSGSRVDKFWQVAIATAMFVGATLLGVYLYRRFRHGRSLEQMTVTDNPPAAE
ncbi:MAG: VTT domain-containing protein [Gammaproteobacteria bacterium]